MFWQIICALCWFGLSGLVSIDYVERLKKKGDVWRAWIAFPVILILAPFIGLGGVAGEIIDAIIDDDEGDGANV